MNSDEDDGPETDIEGIDEFPDMEFDENEQKKYDSPDEAEKSGTALQNVTKSGDSLQTSLWINPNERELDDLKKLVPFYQLLTEFETF